MEPLYQSLFLLIVNHGYVDHTLLSLLCKPLFLILKKWIEDNHVFVYVHLLLILFVFFIIFYLIFQY